MKRTLMTLFFAGLILAGTYIFAVTRNLPDVDKVLEEGINPTHFTQIFASNGTPIMSFGKFHHKRVPLANISPYFTEALLATEDRRFRVHKGVDPLAIGRAIIADVTHGKIKEGGSTLTQQLARNVFLSNERSFSRKVREAALAMKLESRLSKDEILELYVNNIYFGEGAYGIGAASEIYFNKPPGQLTVPEAALLAGLPQAPSGYSPFQNPEDAKTRRNEVIDNLAEVGKITADEAANYKETSLRVNRSGQTLSASDKAPFFNRYVMEQVQRYFNVDEQTFWQSGLKVYTTLDLQAQQLAEQAVVSRSAAYGRTRPNQQAALLSLEPQTGKLIAYVGGRNYQQSQFDRVSSARRSPGSLFKIFTYTTAIDRGIEPSTVYLDQPIRYGDWEPKNYDKRHHGAMTVARALVQSNNIVAVKVLDQVTPGAVVGVAHQMGIQSPLEENLSLTLGSSGVNLLEITSAFGVLANQGTRVEPYGIEKITDEAGKILYEHHPVSVGVLSRPTTDTMTKMMMGVIQRGTGRAASIGRPLAGKTGTSDDYRDAWFIGFTPDVVTGVWVGNDNNSPMPGMTGGALPATIWKAYMGPFMSGKPVKDFDLAYSKPLTEADFTTADLSKLNEKDKAGGIQPVQGGELDPATDPNAPVDPYLDPIDPNADPNAPQLDPDTNVGGNPPDNGQGRSPVDPIYPVQPPPPMPPSNPPPQRRPTDVTPSPQPTRREVYQPANPGSGRIDPNTGRINP